VTHYETGKRFEDKTRKHLVENGYDVIRAAGSKGSTKVDLVAVKPGQQLFIQCKSDGDLPPAEWDRVLEVARWVNALPILAANGPKGRGITYIHLLGPKRRGLHMANQPCAVFHVDQIVAAGQPIGPLPGQTASARGADGLTPPARLSGAINQIRGRA
jgi:Holliday junction resolvase